MKFEKLVVSKGRSYENEDGTWIKPNYEITVSLNSEEELQLAKDKAENILDRWLKLGKEISVLQKPKTLIKKFTQWKPTKNPNIEWAPSRDASDEDLERAKDLEEKNVWCLESEYGRSIFRKLNVLEGK